MQRLKTFAAAAIGVAIFHALSLPLPFLLGPMFACLAVALGGARLSGTPAISDLMRTILGVAVGASVTPELVGRLGAMAASVALVPLFVLVIGAIGYPYFRRLCGLDGPTAYYAAMPGGLQDMIVFGQEAGADPRALSLIHATRVLVIVSAMPVILTLGWGMSFAAPPGAPALSIPPHELALMAFCAIAGWKGAERIGLFGASILGPLALTAAFSLAGLIHHRPPAEAILAAQFFIGLGVGVKYVGVTWDELRRFVLASLGFCAMLAGLSVVFAEGVFLGGLAPQVEAILAFAPGGQAEMAVLAIVAGVDVAFVVTHHLVRIVVVITGAPIAARLLRWRR
jgi:membrane AbrB-like protein